jgi:hypothetical protein
MNWRTPVTLIVLVLLVVGGTLVGWRYATQELPDLRDTAGDEPEQTCRTYNSGQALKTGAVTVNVYNTPGGISGLAGQTMERLITRGFVGGVTENSSRRVTRGTVLLTAADPTSAQVRLVRRQLDGEVLVRRSGNPAMGTSVNIFLGRQFPGLSGDAPKQIRVRGRTKVCFEVEE